MRPVRVSMAALLLLLFNAVATAVPVDLQFARFFGSCETRYASVTDPAQATGECGIVTALTNRFNARQAGVVVRPQIIEHRAYYSQLGARIINRDVPAGSQRGLHGGFTLLRSPADLTIYDVVQAIDPIVRITTCPLNLPNHATSLCPLHRRLDNAMAAIETAFRKTSIKQLLTDPNPSKPLCAFPRNQPD